jgi:hypothetical protein
MFDIENLSNYVIFLIPVAIVISRFVRRAKAKREPPPKKPPKPYIPVHFEDDSDEDNDYFRNRDDQMASEVSPLTKSPSRKTVAARAQKTVASPFASKPDIPVFDTIRPVATTIKSVRPLSQPQRDFSFNFNHLSQLKQAVIMAEILGQPKAMTGE